MDIYMAQSINPGDLEKKTKKEARILIVDDDKDVGQLFQQLFDDPERGYFATFHHATHETSARQLVDTYGNEGITALITDYNMPNMNGLELISAFREVFSDNLVYVLVSGNHNVKIKFHIMSDSLKNPYQLRTWKKQ